MLDTSYGIIPLRYKQGVWEVLMVQALEGWWGLPKGHAEADESPQEAAAREFSEETSLRIVRILDPKPFVEHYKYLRAGLEVEKCVYYFVALVEGVLTIQADEIRGAAWVPCTQATEKATYPELKALLKGVQWEKYG
jgi:bis(5'-nucleosidyl)-tetraphosphatase